MKYINKFFAIAICSLLIEFFETKIRVRIQITKHLSFLPTITKGKYSRLS